MKLIKILIAVVIIGSAGGMSSLFAGSTVDDHKDDEKRIDSLEKSLPRLENKVLSTLMFGGSSPISFTGEARLKGMYHRYADCPTFLGPRSKEAGQTDSIAGDRSRLGIEGGVRLGMIVQPGRNLTLWSRLGFTSQFPGRVIRGMYNPTDSSNYSHHLVNKKAVTIFEDMCAGIAIRTKPAAFWLKCGAINWLEASPFTIWKAEPRAFAWEWLEYELEQPIATYYEYNVAIGEKTGRAAWHKKAFFGMNLESIQLPQDFYVNLLYAKFPEYDTFEREYMDFASDLGYAAEDQDKVIIETGYGDSYRHIFHTRLAKKMKELTLGLNYNSFFTSDDVIYAQNPYSIYFNSMFDLRYANGAPNWYDEYRVNSIGDTIPLDCGRGFYKEPKIASIDLRGKLGSHFSMHADVGLSRIDTTWVLVDTVEANQDKIPLTIKKTEKASSDVTPAFFTNLGFKSKVIELRTDLAYIKEGFYSPYSFAAPMDAFTAFGSNLLGSGTFVSKSETSPYFQNMAGGQLTIVPKVPGYGHLRIKYGQHYQPEKGRDLLYFPYRLNGQDINSTIKSTYTLYGMGTVDYPMAGVKYNRRLGDESYDPPLIGEHAHLEEGPEKGGLHADYHSLYESFVPYDDSLQVLYNIACRSGSIDRHRELGTGTIGRVITGNGDTVAVSNSALRSSKNGFVPTHKKYTFNFEVDVAHDIGPWLNYKNDFFLAGYAAINSISTAPKPFAVNLDDEDLLLWSLYLRFEPCIALTKKFYLGMLIGYENWRSDKAWMNLSTYEGGEDDGKEDLDNPLIKRVPMNYKDAAYGIGFDWDMLERMGLHGRVKWMTHRDENFKANNYETIFTSLEVTMFF
jgi:hypothetical protein